MKSALLAICLALHTLSTVLLVGNYILSALVIIPVLRRLVPEEEQAKLIVALVSRSRPWVISSLLAFIVTGTAMLVTDSQYLGFMDFGNTWSIGMVAKHLLVIAVIGMGVYLDMGITRRLSGAGNSKRPARLAQFRRMNNLTALGCIAVLLITTAVQVM
jgi:uncharacterized membrane protein